MRRWSQRYHRARTLAVSLLILALLPTPWPKVEFHNVRHHDEAGQVCEYHDHLLRWHPDAAASDDVAILHCHWGWPTQDPDDAGHSGNVLRLHAFLPDQAVPAAEVNLATVADPGPVSGLLASSLPPLTLALDLAWLDPGLLRSSGASALPFSATFAPRTSLTALLQRWSC